MKLPVAVGALVMSGVGLWLVPEDRGERGGRGDRLVVAASASIAPGAGGASPVHEGAAETTGGAVVTEIETITGTIDGMALVGRRVDLHVDVLARAADRALWIGSPDNRVLVVARRDAGHGILPVRDGQRAAIAGVVRPVPKPDERREWGLTERDEQELLDRKIFIRADVVTAEGHGTP